jgi:hypothetical protein
MYSSRVSSVRCVCRHSILINDPHSSQPLAGLANVHLHSHSSELNCSACPHLRPMLLPARMRHAPISAAASAAYTSWLSSWRGTAFTLR